jgi:hypothetical protein
MKMSEYNLSKLNVKDKKGRVLLKINEFGQVALARYPNMSEYTIKKLCELLAPLLEGDEEKDQKIKNVVSFLRFESDENMFCS